MNRVKYLEKIMSRHQKELYAQIVAQKHYKARGQAIRTCTVLRQLGLIMLNPESNDLNEYVLNGKPLTLPFVKKLPLPKDVIKEITQAPAGKPEAQLATPSQKHIPVLWASPATPPAVYSNVSREQHVERWLMAPVKVKAKRFTAVKCLEVWQMEYIMDNHEQKSAQEMADHLGKEKYEVLLFCQANAIEPVQRKSKQISYNGPQKKTA